MIKKLFLALGAIVLFVVLFFAAIVGYNLYADSKAEHAAGMLCGAIRVGSDINSVIVAAAQGVDKSRLMIYEGEHHFVFQGGVHHSRECIAKVSNDKVVSVRVKADTD